MSIVNAKIKAKLATLVADLQSDKHCAELVAPSPVWADWMIKKLHKKFYGRIEVIEVTPTGPWPVERVIYKVS